MYFLDRDAKITICLHFWTLRKACRPIISEWSINLPFSIWSLPLHLSRSVQSVKAAVMLILSLLSTMICIVSFILIPPFRSDQGPGNVLTLYVNISVSDQSDVDKSPQCSVSFKSSKSLLCCKAGAPFHYVYENMTENIVTFIHAKSAHIPLSHLSPILCIFLGALFLVLCLWLSWEECYCATERWKHLGIWEIMSPWIPLLNHWLTGNWIRKSTI